MTDAGIELDHIAQDFHLARAELEPLSGLVMGVEEAPRVPLHDVSEAGDERARQRYQALLDRTRAVSVDSLDRTQHTTHAMVEMLATQVIEQLDLRAVEMTLDAFFGGPQAILLLTLPKTTVRTREQATDYLARLQRIPTLFTDTVDRLRAGPARGLTTTRRGAQAAADQARTFAATGQQDNPLLLPLMGARSAGVDAVDGLLDEAWKILVDTVRPAFSALADAVEADIVPSGRPDDRPGLCHLDTGPAIYASALRMHTTTDRDPEEIHQLGLDCVARLADEYAAIGPGVLGTSQPQEIFTRLREDPELRYADPTEAVAVAQACVDRAAAAVGEWIGRVPAKPCVVQPMPAGTTAGMTVAYYQPPQSADAPHGTYWINTVDPVVTRYEAEAVAFHEAIPGHHTQLALQAELDLPRFRQVGLILSAYQEGWGLYAERLADQMGLYSSDLARLGMVATDSLRACRLVVDTGLHHLGWTRQQAIDYMTANSPLSHAFITTEVDRYIVYPGQACAYMLGRVEILRLRQQAEEALGAAFDLPAFHDVLLGEGAVPLAVLDNNVTNWIHAQT